MGEFTWILFEVMKCNLGDKPGGIFVPILQSIFPQKVAGEVFFTVLLVSRSLTLMALTNFQIRGQE